MFEGRLEMYIMLFAGSAFCPDAYGFLKAGAGGNRFWRFRRNKRAPRGALESGRTLGK